MKNKYIKIYKGIFDKAKFNINIKKGLVICPVCGILKVEHGDIIHPAVDKICAELLNNGFTVNYIK